MERTLALVKPDGVERCLIGEVIAHYERKGLHIADIKMVVPTRELVEEHYKEHKGKDFFDELVDYLTGRKMCIRDRAMPSIISGITLSIISIIGYSAMAGAVGANGLGKVAITYGYTRFDNKVMFYTVVVLIIVVQLIQTVGNVLYKKLK